MAFPGNWCQCWWTLPFTNNRLPEQLCQSLLQWFDYDPLPPIGFNFVTAAHALMVWFESTVMTTIVSPPHMPAQKPELRMYMNFSGTVVRTQVLSSLAYARAACLPPSKPVVVRRWTSLTQSPGNARVFVSGVPLADAEGGFLSVAAKPFWDLMANNMANSVVTQGVRFRPCVASYRDSTFLPILDCTANPKLGLLKRRARRSDHAIPLTPKAPPP